MKIQKYEFQAPWGQVEIETWQFSDRLCGILQTEWSIKTLGKESIFAFDEIFGEEGQRGIYIGDYGGVAKAIQEYYGTKKEVAIRIPENIYQALVREEEENQRELRERVKNKKVSYWIFTRALGYGFFLTTDDLTEEELQCREDVEEFLEKYEELDTKFNIYKLLTAHAEKTNYDEVVFQVHSGWWKISDENLWEIVRPLIERLKKEEEEKEKAEKEREARIFATAKETGEKQLLYRYIAGCNDKNEECDVDVVCIYALPDGKTEKKRFHTW